MNYALDANGQQRLEQYFSTIGEALQNKKRREAFSSYAIGLLSDLDRKSVEPIAAMTCPSPEQVNPAHQRLLHFIGQSAWDDAAVRHVAASYGLSALQEKETVEAWIFDDTGFLKQGAHSVGVQRQYTGSAGKIANCQIGVSLSLATPGAHLPVDFELYLPRRWTEDPARRREVKIPDDVVFQTKPELAVQMIDRAIEYKLPCGIVLADCAYGNSSHFRQALRERGLDYAVGVQGTTKAWRLDSGDCKRGPCTNLESIASRLEYRRTTWTEGTKAPLVSRFASCRVLIEREDSQAEEPEAVWLLVEWPHGEKAPGKFFIATLPRFTARKELVRVVKQRWRTERVYQDMKGDLGLDHFEGRMYSGWHHHVTVALCCYAFIIAEHARHFPPPLPWTRSDPTKLSAARTTFR